MQNPAVALALILDMYDQCNQTLAALNAANARVGELEAELAELKPADDQAEAEEPARG